MKDRPSCILYAVSDEDGTQRRKSKISIKITPRAENDIRIATHMKQVEPGRVIKMTFEGWNQQDGIIIKQVNKIVPNEMTLRGGNSAEH